jgi:DNA adenine methylase Dam
MINNELKSIFADARLEAPTFFKSPINYTGNKFRILPQIVSFFPKSRVGTFVDIFCGGATVGINANADKVYLVDHNERVIGLLKFLAFKSIDSIIQSILNIVFDYHLSCSALYSYKYYRERGYVYENNGLKSYNEDGFYRLRDDYNKLNNKKTFRANSMLYILMVYGFNNDMRFNRSGEFNLPVGKTDLNNNNLRKIIQFNSKAQRSHFVFICDAFDSEFTIDLIDRSNFAYFDPPYLLSNAVYNSTSSWTFQSDIRLLKYLQKLNNKNYNFALSNILRTTQKQHSLLDGWIRESPNISVERIVSHYRSASYNKVNRQLLEQEVLIHNG